MVYAACLVANIQHKNFLKIQKLNMANIAKTVKYRLIIALIESREKKTFCVCGRKKSTGRCSKDFYKGFLKMIRYREIKCGQSCEFLRIFRIAREIQST